MDRREVRLCSPAHDRLVLEPRPRGSRKAIALWAVAVAGNFGLSQPRSGRAMATSVESLVSRHAHGLSPLSRADLQGSVRLGDLVCRAPFVSATGSFVFAERSLPASRSSAIFSGRERALASFPSAKPASAVKLSACADSFFACETVYGVALNRAPCRSGSRES
jgi:hypothetical protein